MSDVGFVRPAKPLKHGGANTAVSGQIARCKLGQGEPVEMRHLIGVELNGFVIHRDRFPPPASIAERVAEDCVYRHIARTKGPRNRVEANHLVFGCFYGWRMSAVVERPGKLEIDHE